MCFSLARVKKTLLESFQIKSNNIILFLLKNNFLFYCFSRFRFRNNFLLLDKIVKKEAFWI